MIIFFLALMGLSLIFLEFFLPGMILAIVGSLALLASVWLFMTHVSLSWGALYAVGVLLLVVVTCKGALLCLQRSKKGEFYLGKDQEGYVASQFEQSLIGKSATVLTELKPAGHIIVEGKQYQALSETGFVSKGEDVLIVGGRGFHLIVREKKG